ncbi:MAG: 50S ribosomal protein L24 [Aggregatilineales bacterium]
MQRIKKGDTVEVIAGKDIGVRGKVLTVLPKLNRVVVEKVNIVKRHQKQRRTRSGVQQGIIQFEAPIDLSNVMLVCQSCDRRTRVGFRINEEGKKVRVCKKCGQDIE